ncbi:hypothetical protein [Imperialibacter roseus]|uniref:HEPN domain-containing protein n=1 Tax=Imperialibacter roseus TaxID=1324217 RepID=A0ABZ0ILT3_9BACT|nr:hypothetical protein [Imperialibacter roseus]WOK05472.1 hypothetical protein RT717_20570 [Imperialibacter roseus]|tara:strand:- start:15786 stop:16412 length:627 start_codon:yes stop_codon:yes gene_type:complete
MENLKDKLEQNIPEIEFLEERFRFIDNKILRTNISISFQYVIFLITLEEEVTLQGPVSYSIFKNIVLNTASIIEGSLHHLLDTLIKRKLLDSEKILTKEEVYSNKKILFKTDDGMEICGIHLRKKPTNLKTNTSFIEINRACKRARILDDELFEEVEELRDRRNKIHLAGLAKVDDFYEKKDIQQAFKTASKILKLVEERLEIKKGNK